MGGFRRRSEADSPIRGHGAATGGELRDEAAMSPQRAGAWLRCS